MQTLNCASDPTEDLFNLYRNTQLLLIEYYLKYSECAGRFIYFTCLKQNNISEMTVALSPWTRTHVAKMQQALVSMKHYWLLYLRGDASFMCTIMIYWDAVFPSFIKENL